MHNFPRGLRRSAHRAFRRPLPQHLRFLTAGLAVAALSLVGCSGGADSTAAHSPSTGTPVSSTHAPESGEVPLPQIVNPHFDVPGTAAGPGAVPTLTMSVSAVVELPEAPFVQGLEFESDGSLLVGTGLYGQSQIYRLPAFTEALTARPGLSGPPVTYSGAATQVHDLPPEYFGEGITRVADAVWQLTWREGVALKRDASTLEPVQEAALETEGWGVCAFSDTVVTSDGSGTLTMRSPEDFRPVSTTQVSAKGAATTWLNELECVDGEHGREIWANVWQSPYLYRIDASSGEVTGIVDASALIADMVARLAPEQRGQVDVLNGIAALVGGDSGQREFLLTGKLWPVAYVVTISD